MSATERNSANLAMYSPIGSRSSSMRFIGFDYPLIRTISHPGQLRFHQTNYLIEGPRRHSRPGRQLTDAPHGLSRKNWRVAMMSGVPASLTSLERFVGIRSVRSEMFIERLLLKSS